MVKREIALLFAKRPFAVIPREHFSESGPKEMDNSSLLDESLCLKLGFPVKNIQYKHYSIFGARTRLVGTVKATIQKIENGRAAQSLPFHAKVIRDLTNITGAEAISDDHFTNRLAGIPAPKSSTKQRVISGGEKRESSCCVHKSEKAEDVSHSESDFASEIDSAEAETSSDELEHFPRYIGPAMVRLLEEQRAAHQKTWGPSESTQPPDHSKIWLKKHGFHIPNSWDPIPSAKSESKDEKPLADKMSAVRERIPLDLQHRAASSWTYKDWMKISKVTALAIKNNQSDPTEICLGKLFHKPIAFWTKKEWRQYDLRNFLCLLL